MTLAPATNSDVVRIASSGRPSTESPNAEGNRDHRQVLDGVSEIAGSLRVTAFGICLDQVRIQHSLYRHQQEGRIAAKCVRSTIDASRRHAEKEAHHVAIAGMDYPEYGGVWGQGNAPAEIRADVPKAGPRNASYPDDECERDEIGHYLGDDGGHDHAHEPVAKDNATTIRPVASAWCATVRSACRPILRCILKKASGSVWNAESSTRTEPTLTYCAAPGSLNTDSARKPADRNSTRDNTLPVTTTVQQADRKSSRIVCQFVLAAKKRTIATPKPSRPNGTIRDTVTVISDQTPYRDAPRPFVKIGTLTKPERLTPTLAARA